MEPVDNLRYRHMNSAVLFLEEAADTYCEKTALKSDEGAVTYGQMRHNARVIGTSLLSFLPKKANVINPVPVLMKKSIEAVAAFMGVLYSGNP